MDVQPGVFLAKVNKSAIVEHLRSITGQDVVMSELFSAGQHWCCLELVAEDGTLFIVRLQQPSQFGVADLSSKTHRIICEVSTMNYVRTKTSIPVPKVFAYEVDGSSQALLVGAPYMIIEGFRGTTLQDAANLYELPKSIQKKIFDQWASIQVELATLSFSHIGVIGDKQDANENPAIDSIATDEAGSIGPFSSAVAYFETLAIARFKSACEAQTAKHNSASRFDVLGPYIYLDVIQKASIFKSLSPGPFPLNHMDIGPQNILVDHDFNIIAVIDWEMAHAAPWEALYFPMPFPTNVENDVEFQRQLNDTEDVAHEYTSKIHELQKVYIQGFQRAEAELKDRGMPLAKSLASILQSDLSKIYWMMEHHGRSSGEWDEIFMFATARIAFSMDETMAEEYFNKKERELKTCHFG